MDRLAESPQQAIKRRGLLPRLRDRIRFSWPPLNYLLLGALIWGALMALSGFASLYLSTGLATFNTASIILLFFFGGLIGWFSALPFASFAALDHRPETRFCSFFLFLTIATIASTAFLFAMNYRIYYAQWHAPFATKTWVFQFVFTTAGAVYQFAVIGMRHYFPLGLIFLTAASLLLAKRMR